MPHAALVPALSFMAGIALGLWSASGVPAWSGLLLVSLIVSVGAFRAGHPGLLLAAVCTGWAAAGALLAIDADAVARDPPLRRWLPDDDAALVIEGRLWEDAVLTASGVALVVDIDRVVRAGESVHVRGRALLSMTGDTGAAPVDEWRAGRRLRAPAWLRAPTRYRNPGGPDHRLALARRGVAVVGSIKSATLVDVIATGGPIDEAGAAVRAAVRRLVARSIAPWSERSAAITTAILIGDRAGLDDAVTRALQEAGTYHVIAISGGNVAILAGCLLVGGRVLRLPWRANLGTAATVLVGYAHLASGGSSVTRATTMAVVYLAARMLDHRGSAAGSLGIAATLILCGAPLSLVEPGFLLTFGATTAMLVLVPAVAASVRHGWLRAPATLLAASVASELALMPVGAVFFSRVTLAGLLLNFAAVPLMTVVQVGGMAALGVAALAPSAAVLVGWVPHAAAEGLVVSADLVQWVPWLAWRVAPPTAWTLACYYGALASTTALVLAWPHWPRRVARRLVPVSAGTFALSAGCILWAPAFDAYEPRAVRLMILDVGQGDASVVEVIGGRTMAIDAGGLAGTARFDIGERVVAPVLWARGIRSLDALVITHGDADHVGGAPALLELFPTREIWEGVPVPAHEPLAKLASAAARRGVPWRTVQDGDRLRLGPLTIDVLHPPRADWERQRIRNDDSVVLELRVGDVSIVLPGDTGAEVEPSLAARLAPARLRVLKAGHHGSRTSSSAAFVEALRPTVAVISCGQRNRYGHPSPEVVARFRAAGAHVFRTDEDGAVTIETDGRELVVSTWSGRRVAFTPDGVTDLAGRSPRPTPREAVEQWMRATQAR